MIDGLEALGFSQPGPLAARLERFADLLLEHRDQTNLTGARSLDELVTRHFLDSLALVGVVPIEGPVVDVGSGAGLPGIPIAMAYPAERLTLIEPRRKRAQFLDLAIGAMGLTNVEVLQKTARAAAGAGLAAGARLVVMRAVAKTAAALEHGLPLVAPGGALALYKGREARPAARDLRLATAHGAKLASAKAVIVPHLAEERHIWLFRKPGRSVLATPERVILGNAG